MDKITFIISLALVTTISMAQDQNDFILKTHRLLGCDEGLNCNDGQPKVVVPANDECEANEECSPPPPTIVDQIIEEAETCSVNLVIPPRYRTESVPTDPVQEFTATVFNPKRVKTTSQQILVREAYEKIEVVPAEFENVRTQVLVEPETFRFETVPAQFESVEEKVEVEPERTAWQKGRGPIQKIDENTGEILSLVSIPAKFKTVTRRVLKKPETVQKIYIPPVYKIINTQVLKASATTRKVIVPAEYETVQVSKVLRESSYSREAIPVRQSNMVRRVAISPRQLENREVLCPDQITRKLVTKLQDTLLSNGYNPGPLDGLLGKLTMSALNRYQAKNGLPVDKYLNTETLRALQLY